MRTIDPAVENPQNIYRLLIGSVLPRPIAFVSSISADGVPNLAPFSFFTVASANPPVVCFTPLARSADGGKAIGGKKDTLANIEATGEFVVNIVSESFASQMNVCSGEYPPDVDEFAMSGLTPVASDLVKPARVAESLVQMECKLLQVVRLGDRPLAGNLVLGTVVRFHVADSIANPFRIEPVELRAIGRMGGAQYARTTDLFELIRPEAGGNRSS